MSDRTPPGEPEPGSTPPPAPSWASPPPEQHGPPHGAGHPAYPQQGLYAGGFPAGPVTNQKAQWSLALGLLAVPLACCSVLLGLVGVVAIVLGVQARREIAASGGQQTGEGLATTGMVAGALATLIVVLLGVLLMMLVIGGELLVTTS